jgi:DNA repair protein RadA/Sms
VYVNIVGGLHPEGTSTDLAVAAAIWSDEKGVSIASDTLLIGEIGLTGDLRPVMNAEKLASEAARLGFKKMILPKRSLDRMLKKPEKLVLVGVKSVAEAMKALS